MYTDHRYVTKSESDQLSSFLPSSSPCRLGPFLLFLFNVRPLLSPQSQGEERRGKLLLFGFLFLRPTVHGGGRGEGRGERGKDIGARLQRTKLASCTLTRTYSRLPSLFWARYFACCCGVHRRNKRNVNWRDKTVSRVSKNSVAMHAVPPVLVRE